MYHLLRKCRRQVRLLHKEITLYYTIDFRKRSKEDNHKYIKACYRINNYEKTIHELKHKPKDTPVSYTNWKFLLKEGIVKNG